MAVQAPSAESAPDVRGTSSRTSLIAFVSGIVAMSSVLGGTILIQAVYALFGSPTVSPQCVAEGIEPRLTGAVGVCHIIGAFRSRAESIALIGGIAIALVAIAVGFTSYRRMENKRRKEQCIAGGVLGVQSIQLAVLLLWFRSGNMATFTRNFLNIEVLEGSLSGFLRGIKNTLILAFSGEIGGIVIGLLLAVLAISERRTVRAPARAYINFFRGTPLLWQLSFFYFLILIGFRLPISTFQIAILVFSLNTGAYAAEVFRAGIQSIEKGQIEAARSLGMTYMQSMRYAIVPQAVRRVIPPLLNEFVILIKDTSLILVLGLVAAQLDIYNFSRQVYSETGNATAFVATALGYLAITLPLIGVVNAVERRLRSGLLGVTHL